LIYINQHPLNIGLLKTRAFMLFQFGSVKMINTESAESWFYISNQTNTSIPLVYVYMCVCVCVFSMFEIKMIKFCFLEDQWSKEEYNLEIYTSSMMIILKNYFSVGFF
jgi:hypothetical protein